MGVVSRIYCCNEGGSGVIFVCLEVGSQVLQRFITRTIDSWPFVEDFATTLGLGLGLTNLLFATFCNHTDLFKYSLHKTVDVHIGGLHATWPDRVQNLSCSFVGMMCAFCIYK